MKEIISKVTNFVNENTMLLIGICAFLIVVLIVYLIDNSIKSKKMQKAIKEMDAVEDKVIESSESIEETPKDSSVDFEIKNEEPSFDSISLGDETPAIEDEVEETPIEEPKVEETVTEDIEINPPVEEPVKETKEVKFTNKKSLSEILSKKKESINKNDNLDLNNDTEKTLEETTEFNNTF